MFYYYMLLLFGTVLWLECDVNVVNFVVTEIGVHKWEVDNTITYNASIGHFLGGQNKVLKILPLFVYEVVSQRNYKYVFTLVNRIVSAALVLSSK